MTSRKVSGQELAILTEGLCFCCRNEVEYLSSTLYSRIWRCTNLGCNKEFHLEAVKDADMTLETWFREISKTYGVNYSVQLAGFTPTGIKFYLTPQARDAEDKPETIIVELDGNNCRIQESDRKP